MGGGEGVDSKVGVGVMKEDGCYAGESPWVVARPTRDCPGLFYLMAPRCIWPYLLGLASAQHLIAINRASHFSPPTGSHFQ